MLAISRDIESRREFPAAPDIPRAPVPHHIPEIPTLNEQRALLDAIPMESPELFLARGLLGVRDEEAARANLADYRRGPTRPPTFGTYARRAGVIGCSLFPSSSPEGCAGPTARDVYPLPGSPCSRIRTLTQLGIPMHGGARRPGGA